MLSGNFAEMTTSTPFWDLLHAANLRHGTDGFTSPPKEGVLTASAGLEPAKLGTKGQHATPRPPKPLNIVKYQFFINKMFLHCVFQLHVSALAMSHLQVDYFFLSKKLFSARFKASFFWTFVIRWSNVYVINFINC